MVAGIGEVVGLVGGGQPDAGFAAVIEHDALGQAEAEIVLEELATAADIGGEAVPVIEPAHVAAARRETLRLVLERRLLIGRRVVPFGVVIKLDHVPVGVLADEGLAVAEVAVAPADVEAGAFQRGGAPLQRLGRARAIGDMRHAVGFRGGELERIALVVVVAAQIDAVAFLAALGHAHHVDEKARALVEARRQQFEVPEMGDVEIGFRRHGALHLVVG